MIFLRSFLYQVVLVSSSLAYSLAVLVVSLFGSEAKVDRLGRGWGEVNLRALKRICGLDYQVTGLENLPCGSAVVLSKHQSAWETIAFRALLPDNQSWVLKKELTQIPVFGWALRKFRPIAIDRAAGRREITRLIKEGKDRLESGRMVIVFPEGTRVAPGTKHPYGIGGALLAERGACSVVPIAHNAGVYWGRRSLMKRPGTIQVVIGPAIPTMGLKATEINARTEAWIESTLETLPQC